MASNWAPPNAIRFREIEALIRSNEKRLVVDMGGALGFPSQIQEVLLMKEIQHQLIVRIEEYPMCSLGFMCIRWTRFQPSTNATRCLGRFSSFAGN